MTTPPPNLPDDEIPADLAELLADLPVEVEPENDLWDGIRDQITPVPLDCVDRVERVDRAIEEAGRRQTPGSRTAMLWMAGLLAAAAVVMVARAVLPGASGPETASTAVMTGVSDDAPAGAAGEASLGDPALDHWEAEVRQTTDDLLAILDDRRSDLDPEAVAVVEGALVDIDAAIADVREALALDPDNDGLQEALAGVYQRKVHLLRTMTELPPSTGEPGGGERSRGG